MTVTGSAAQTLGQILIVDNDGLLVLDADGDQVVEYPGASLTQTASGIVGTFGVSGTSSVTLDDLTQTAVASLGMRTSVEQTLSTVTQEAEGRLESVSGEQEHVLPNVTQSAAGSIPDVTRLDNTVAPVVSGTASKGSTLSCTAGTWDSYSTPDFSYQWRRDGKNIHGETNSTYLIVSADVQKSLTCIVTAANQYKIKSQVSNSLTVSGRRASSSGQRRHKFGTRYD